MKKLLFLSVSLLLIGCATPYQKDDVLLNLLLLRFGGGYQDARIQENMFVVVFRGNGYTLPERAGRFALLRCAEVCLENGFNYFVIVGDKSGESVTSFVMPTQSYTTGNADAYGNNITYSENTYRSGGAIIPIRSPRASYTIKCFVEKPEINQLVYDAKQITRFVKK